LVRRTGRTCAYPTAAPNSRGLDKLDGLRTCCDPHGVFNQRFIGDDSRQKRRASRPSPPWELRSAYLFAMPNTSSTSRATRGAGEFVEGSTIVRRKSSPGRFQRMLRPTRAIGFRLIMTQLNAPTTSISPGRYRTTRSGCSSLLQPTCMVDVIPQAGQDRDLCADKMLEVPDVWLT
jgi:hypothetical protein